VNRRLNIPKGFVFSGAFGPASWKARTADADALLGMFEHDLVLHDFNQFAPHRNDTASFIDDTDASRTPERPKVLVPTNNFEGV
jgi:hypothetical protein